MHKHAFSVAKTLEETVFMFSEQAKQKGIELTCACANAAHQAVDGDEGRLKEAIANFVSNALKFTEEGSVSVVATLAEDGPLTIRVQDTGPGIAEVSQAAIFDKFEQAENSTTRHFGGTGLGLVISKQLSGSGLKDFKEN